MRVVAAALDEANAHASLAGQRLPEGLGEFGLILTDARAALAGAVGGEVEGEGRVGGDEVDVARGVRLVEGGGEGARGGGGGDVAGGDGGDAGGEEGLEGAAECGAGGDGDGLVVVAAGVHAGRAGGPVLGHDDGDAQLAVRRELVDHVVEEGEAGGDLTARAQVHHRRLGDDRAVLRAAGAVGPRHGRRGDRGDDHATARAVGRRNGAAGG